MAWRCVVDGIGGLSVANRCEMPVEARIERGKRALFLHLRYGAACELYISFNQSPHMTAPQGL
jgi:hypothetical protein